MRWRHLSRCQSSASASKIGFAESHTVHTSTTDIGHYKKQRLIDWLVNLLIALIVVVVVDVVVVVVVVVDIITIVIVAITVIIIDSYTEKPLNKTN